MDMLRASVDDPDPNQGRRLVAHPPLSQNTIELRVAAELRTADDELMVTGIHRTNLPRAALWACAFDAALRRRNDPADFDFVTPSDAPSGTCARLMVRAFSSGGSFQGNTVI